MLVLEGIIWFLFLSNDGNVFSLFGGFLKDWWKGLVLFSGIWNILGIEVVFWVGSICWVFKCSIIGYSSLGKGRSLDK